MGSIQEENEDDADMKEFAKVVPITNKSYFQELQIAKNAANKLLKSSKTLKNWSDNQRI